MGLKVLLVDDSVIVRKVLKKVLGLSGLLIDRIDEAGNGVEAISALEQGSADVVFLDINMPVMNGVEFLRAIRARSQFENTPVLVVSTEGSETRIEELGKLGISGYLRKPATPEQIVSAVNGIFSVKEG